MAYGPSREDMLRVLFSGDSLRQKQKEPDKEDLAKLIGAVKDTRSAIADIKEYLKTLQT